MKHFLLSFSLLAFLYSPGAYAQTSEEKIKSIMQAQVEQWNKGNIEGFMKGYWESDELVFIGSKGLTYGWKKTLENYKKGYPDRAAMGNLDFTFKEFKPLGRRHMLVIGKWHIHRTSGESLEGHFSLIWELKGKNWVIIADHSS
ncbi:MAG: YybH family protein [Cyclobacteriaceae bacterium]|jgi:hypothetical protein